MTSTTVNLEDIGWTPVLEFYLSELDDSSLIAGRVSRTDMGRALLMTAEGERAAVWARPLPMVDDEAIDEPAIGDWCAASQHDELLRIESVFPRKTCLVRAVASGKRAVQNLAANVDVAFIVAGLDGDWNLRRIERYLALARAGDVRPVIVLNKADLCETVDVHCLAVERIAPGVVVIALSALRDDAETLLRGELSYGQTAVFLGSSGAGKSTLINRLLGRSRPETQLRTTPVRADDSRGRHTTTHRQLYLLPNGGAVIDSPGLRAVGVLADDESLAQAFPEIAQIGANCRFSDCRHEEEPGCAVHAAVAAGALDSRRLESYVKIRKESENSALRQDAYAHRDQERRTVGKYKKLLKDVYRLKGRE